MVGRRIKRKAAKDSAASMAQQKAELLEKKRASLAKARAAKARKFQQRRKKKHAQMSATTATTTATATTASAASGPAIRAGPTAAADGGGGPGRDAQQKCRRSPENAIGGESVGPAVGRGSDPGLEGQDDSTSRDVVLEHAAAAQKEAVLLRQDGHRHAMADQQSSEERHLGGSGDDRHSFIPSGVLVGHRILHSFGDDDGSGSDGCSVLRSPTSEEAEEVDSALFIGTVVSYRPPKVYEDLMPRNDVEDQNVQDEAAGSGGRRRGRKKKKKRRGRPRKDAVQELDYALYRVQFDDGDVMDMEPKEVFQCSQLYDAKREELTGSSSEYTGPPMIMGKDQDDPHQPANLESGLREIVRHANPSCDSLLANPTTLRALDTEIQGYWVQYRVHHIQRGIPRPPSMLSDEEHRQHRAAMASPSHHRSDDAALFSPFANEQLGVVDVGVQGSDVMPPPAFDFHDDVPLTPGGSLSLDKPSHTPPKRAVSHGICEEEEDGKPAARRHRQQLSDSSLSARRSAPARGREDVSIVSDDDSSHFTEDAVEADTTAPSAQSLNVREAPSVSPEHTGPESPQASCNVADTLPSPNPNQDLPHDTEHEAHVESQPSLHLDEGNNNASSQQDHSSSFDASKETGPSSSGSDTINCAQEETPSAPGQTNPDEDGGTSVASAFSHAFNGKLYGFEKRVSHQHRRMKKPKVQGRARFPVLPLASRKRKQGPCSPSDEVTGMASAATDAITVTPSPVGTSTRRSQQKVAIDNVDLPNLAPAEVASPVVVGRDEIKDISKCHKNPSDHESGAVQKQISLANESCKTSCDDDIAARSPSDEIVTTKPNRELLTILVPGGEQIEICETPRDSEHLATMHEFAEIMAAPSPARASVTFAASVKEAIAEELPASSGSGTTSVATACPDETTPATAAPLADAVVGRMINGEDGARRQNYSILSRAYAVGPGLHRGRGPDIHVVLSAVYEPLSSQSSTKADSDSTTSGVLPSLQMQQSQDSASRYMSSDYRYRAEVADDSRISSLPNITHLAQGLAKKYSLSGEWSARIDLVLSVEGNGLARWPGTPSVDRYTAVSVMSGFPPERFPAEIIDGATSIAASFKEERVVDITKGHLRGQRGVVRKVIRPDKLLVMVLESGNEKEHLIIATDARQLSQEEVVKSLLQGPNKRTYSDMNMSDLDHAMGSPNPRLPNEDFLADVDHMLNEELHEIDAVSAMNMFPPGDPGRVSTFVPTFAALSALKASPYSADGRAVRRRRTVRKPKGQGGRRRKSDMPSSAALLAGTDASGGTTKKKRGRKRKNDSGFEPSTSTAKRRGRKPVSDDEGSNNLNRTTDGTKRRGRKPSTSTTRRGRSSASKDGAHSPTTTNSRRRRAPRIEGESTTRIKIRQPVPGKVSDEESVGVELQLPVPKRQRRGNHWKTKAAQALHTPKEPAVQKAALDRVETMLRQKAKRVKGTEKWDKIASGVSHGKGDISVHTWGLLALLGVFEMRNAVSSLGYKPVGNKIDMLRQLSAAYENLGLEMPKVDV